MNNNSMYSRKYFWCRGHESCTQRAKSDNENKLCFLVVSTVKFTMQISKTMHILKVYVLLADLNAIQ